MRRETAYCHTCNQKVRHVDKRCPLCKKLLWELDAQGDNRNKLRTTKETYKQANREDLKNGDHIQE